MYDRTFSEIALYARRLFGLDTEAARDAVQETYQAAAQAWDVLGVLGADEVVGWLKRVCRNKSADHYRRTKSDERRLRSLGAALQVRPSRWEDADPGDVVAARDQVEQSLSLFKASVLAMPPMRQKVVDLFWGQARPYAEIAGELNLSLSTVRWHVSKARADVRRVLGEQQTSEAADEEVRTR
ncbi:sigma-70 family RNA polymerase sigma factor [Streptomyces sp. NPDC055692]|uniref:RNA polymerase sigma factor n=1 Tax=Streptomyces sp. NPDC055692 TaxID=3155683 RepID=UPI00341BC83C